MTPEREKIIRDTWARYREGLMTIIKNQGFGRVTPLLQRSVTCGPVASLEKTEVLTFERKGLGGRHGSWIECDGIAVEHLT